MGRFGTRGADYTPKPGRALKNLPDQFSVQSNGYSFTFQHNWKAWAEYTKEMKILVAKAAAEEVKKALRFVAIEAIKRCPHYSGGLEHAIKVVAPEITGLGARSRIEGSVGVLKSWWSVYDVIYNTGVKSSPELAIFLHEYYDTFIHSTEFGLARKQRKEGITGRRVGSGFLSRAWQENSDNYSLSKAIKSHILKYDAEATIKAEQINQDLEREADSITGSMGND